MTIIGSTKSPTGAITFFCISKNGWKSYMTVNNIFGAEDMHQRCTPMSWDEYNSLPDKQ